MNNRTQPPRHNVICTRIDDDTSAAVDELRGARSRSDYLLEALAEKNARERQATFTARVHQQLGR